MAYTPSSSTASARGRIPTPSRLTGSAIPTPGRSRASSSATATYSNPVDNSPGMSRALTEAIRANDPKQHRTSGRPSDKGSSPRSSPSSQSGASSFAQSSRVSAPRPSNIMTNSTNVMAASSSMSSRAAPPKTPILATRTTMAGFTPRASIPTTSSRPESRQSNANPNANANARGKDRTFEPDDVVRIESLGMEGILRYLGPIEGKPGVWAGVELNPGFAGRGKNDGAVNGVQYFSCAPKGGVFVAQAKLSAPIPRPSSVASSRGRTTPSLPSNTGRATSSMSVSGRVTPSGGRATPAYSTSGRVTPARSVSGRITPSSYATPPAKPRYSAVTPSAAFVTPTAKPRNSTVLEPSFTAGSRASKYVGMTAQQLQNAKNGTDSPKPGSPTRSNVASPFTTPRAPSTTRNSVGIPTPGGSKARQSFGFGNNIPLTSSGTPRSARKTDMPPPPSPVSPSKRLTASSPSSRLSIGLSPSRPPTTSSSPSRRLTTPTGSELSVDENSEARSEHVAELEARNRELQERIANLMSGKLTNGSTTSVSTVPSDLPSQPAQPPEETVPLAQLEEERARNKVSQARISELETQVRFNERAVKERESRLEAIERTARGKEDEIEKVRLEGETRVKELTGKLQDAEALVVSLKVAVDEVREGKKEEAQAIIEAKDKEIELLNAKVTRLAVDREEERKELGGQIDELRQAGQETIALYEEKLGEADSKRWELEDRISEMEEKMCNQNSRSHSPAAVSRHISEAAQIDNEMLKEQVVHYERKVNQLETQLENMRDIADKEEQAMRTRISKYKENDAGLKRDLLEAKTEVETRKRAEMAGKARLEELEEALRENAVALENARAEIEGLRAELGNLEALQAGAVAANTAKTDEDFTRRAVEGAKQGEINQLKDLLESSRASKREALEQYETAKQEAEQRIASLENTLQILESDKAELERVAEDRSSKLTADRKNLEHLKRDLDSKNSEIEQLRRTTSKEKAESVSSRKEHSEEEIAGFKHIIQQLNKENFDITSQLKRIEADKKLLQEECDELREAVKILEANVNDELNKLDNETQGSPVSDDIQKALRDSKAKHELELNRLRQKLHEAEQKHAQTVNNLHKEVSELESLVESKIYREDELERELERCKDKLSRATRKSSKASAESSLPLPPSQNSQPISERPLEGGDVCEICDQPGHDIFSCHLLKDDLAAASGSQQRLSVADSDGSDLLCEDCESYGHIAADCPHSMEVF